MKKIYIVPGVVGLAMLLISGAKNSFVPPTGYTGSTGVYCNGCHGGNTLNAAGGSISVSGLPTAGGYVPGRSYPFSITITHSAANRTRWGFSIAARNGGSAIGSFTTTNANATVNQNSPADQELSHYNSTALAASNSYTYNNLVWTAPSTPPTGDRSVTFYYVGNAANGNGSTSGDFIYSGSTTVALPIEMKSFAATVRNNESVYLQWTTSSESNSDYFEVEKSEDNQFFRSLTQVTAAGNSTKEQSYSYTDRTVTSYNKPVFYRLKLVDKDGQFKLSKVVRVQLAGRKNFVENVYPTIVNTNMLVTAEITSDKDQPVQVQLVSMNGSILKTVKEQLTTGSNVIGVRLPASLPTQWVYARFVFGTTNQTIPLMVHP